MFSLSFESLDRGGRAAIVTIGRDEPDGYALRPEDLATAESTMDSVEGEGDIRAVVLRSRNPDVFMDEVSIDALMELTDRRQIESLTRRIHALLSRIRASKRPIVAAVDGRCLGLGFELALACGAVVACSEGRTTFGLPALQRGLLPIGGAITDLPRRISLDDALSVLLRGRQLSAADAYALGLVDRLARPEALFEAALHLAEQMTGLRHTTANRLGAGLRTLGRSLMMRRRGLARWRDEIQVDGHGLDPAPLSALDLIERGIGQSAARALDLEPSVVAELAVGEVARARAAVASYSQTLCRRPVADGAGKVAPAADLQRIGLVGAGVVGADLAVAASEAGLSVRIREKEASSLARAMSRVRTGFVLREKAIGPQAHFSARARVSGGLQLHGFETLDLVLEAVPEELPTKQSVFAELEGCVHEDAVLATHPRALPVSKIGAHLKQPQRLVGIRFFRPVRRMPLCEIVATDHTSARSLATAVAFARRVDKTPLVVRDSAGFFTTRVVAFYLMAAVELVQAGHRIEDVELGATRAGWPIGPLRLLDNVGLDVAAFVAGVLEESFHARIQRGAGLDALVSAGRTFYARARQGPPKPDPEVYGVLGTSPTQTAEPDDLGDRLTLVAALEAVRCLEEGVIRSPRDGDVGAVLGIGYPAQRGGPFRQLAARGLSSLRSRLAALEDRFGPRFAAPDLVVDLANRGLDFASMEES